MRVRYLRLAAVLLLMGALSPLEAQSTFKVLYTFTAESATSPYTNSDGSYPQADLIQSGEVLYGVTHLGGSAGRGAVFRLNTDGTGFENLHSFNGSDGQILESGLVLSGNTLYGTAVDGGSSASGTIFRVNTNGTGFVVLRNFPARIYDPTLNTYTNSDGAWPKGRMVLSGSTLYGTTSLGGLFGNGTVFAIHADGSGFTNLHNFSDSYPLGLNADGAAPHAGLILSGNTLYGVASAGGSAAEGTVFSLRTDGTGFTNLHSFTVTPAPNDTNSDGAVPQAGLLLSNGTLYGTTTSGGGTGEGTVFSLHANGTGFATLHSFAATNTDGFEAQGDLLISGNTLFGTTEFGGSSLYGTVFSLNTEGADFVILQGFPATTNSTNHDGAFPLAGLVLSGNTLRGVASQGGGTGHGTVFALSMAPDLTIVPAGNQSVVSWPSWAANYELQITTDLSSGSWSNVTTGITSLSTGFAFTNALNLQTVFFRLKAQ